MLGWGMGLGEGGSHTTLGIQNSKKDSVEAGGFVLLTGFL